MKSSSLTRSSSISNENKINKNDRNPTILNTDNDIVAKRIFDDLRKNPNTASRYVGILVAKAIDDPSPIGLNPKKNSHTNKSIAPKRSPKNIQYSGRKANQLLQRVLKLDGSWTGVTCGNVALKGLGCL